MTEAAYIYDAIRTPRSKGKADGSLATVKPVHLLAGLLRALPRIHGFDTAEVDDVVMGCVTPVGEQGACLPKTAVMVAGWSERVPAVQLDRYCASGLEAVNIAAQKVASGWENLVVAGGVESMSRVPMGSNGGATLDDRQVIESLNLVPQGISADAIATIGGWTREDVDRVAVMSQQRAASARDRGCFDRSVVPVTNEQGEVVLAQDDFIRPQTTLSTLGALKLSFESMGLAGADAVVRRAHPGIGDIRHVHTAGNSSGIVDGASVVLVGSERAGRRLGLTPRARIVSTAVTSTDPTLMLVGPGPAAKMALAKASLKVSDIDLFEINEAFASVVLRFMQDLNISPEITNVNGGAIAMGHPLGATGGMLVGTILDELERRDRKRGLIALCVGSGMGIATIIERV